MNVFGMFLKRPMRGRVKTRLAAGAGDEAAANLYAAFVADLADRFRGTGHRRILGYTPDDVESREYANTLAGAEYEVWPQPDAELGQRIRAYFEHVWETGKQPTVLIGSDSPSLPPDCVEAAFDALRTRDCVLGPATDGGYYLIGLRTMPHRLFDGIAWSSPCVVVQTIERIVAAGATLAVLPPWYDVDTVDDLQLLRGHVAAMRAAGEHIALHHTEPLLLK